MDIKKIWNFLWHGDSILSWIINILVAFLLVKFLIFPASGFILSTTHPVVAVVSNSMHHTDNFDTWWEKNGAWYIQNGITKSQAQEWKMKNGFNKGDIILLRGSSSYEIGEIIVFRGTSTNPIIHRIVKINNNLYQTKGDDNPDSHTSLGETQIHPNNVIGKAILRIHYLGWLKIWFTSIIDVVKEA